MTELPGCFLITKSGKPRKWEIECRRLKKKYLFSTEKKLNFRKVKAKMKNIFYLRISTPTFVSAVLVKYEIFPKHFVLNLSHITNVKCSQLLLRSLPDVNLKETCQPFFVPRPAPCHLTLTDHVSKHNSVC